MKGERESSRAEGSCRDGGGRVFLSRVNAEEGEVSFVYKRLHGRCELGVHCEKRWAVRGERRKSEKRGPRGDLRLPTSPFPPPFFFAFAPGLAYSSRCCSCGATRLFGEKKEALWGFPKVVKEGRRRAFLFSLPLLRLANFRASPSLKRSASTFRTSQTLVSSLPPSLAVTLVLRPLG